MLSVCLYLKFLVLRNILHISAFWVKVKNPDSSVSMAYLEEVHEAVEVGVETVEPAAVEKRLIGQQPV